MRTRTMLVAVVLSFLALPAFSQTNPTGTISGKLTDQQALPVAGATVTAQSPALQGSRSAVSSANGDYVIPFLPPGDYAVIIELAGFTPVKRSVRISPGQAVPLNATLSLSTVTETLTVTGAAGDDFGRTAPVATSYKKDLIDALPLGRTLVAATTLAPGVQTSGPNGQIAVNGAMSFESLYLVNGVVVNENIRGQSLALFIEDALQETSITTAAVSAEYGRFQGGVVQAVTKSGGNAFSGSFRTTFTNDKWTALTPFPNDRRIDDVIPIYEGTLGGPILKDRLWFFGAGRFEARTANRSTAFTNLNYDNIRDQKRYEGKLTWSITSEHTFKGAYTKIQDKEDGNAFTPIMDFASLVNRETPQDLLSLNYAGILSPKFFVEAQYSRRRFTFVGSGSQFTDLIKGTLLLDRSRGDARYNSPTFCGVCTDEKRDNQNIIAKATYFLSTSSAGSHNVVFGVDLFDDKRYANNHQSGSDYRIFTTGAILRGEQVFPILQPGPTTFIRWTPIFVDSTGNRFRTISAFVNDTWTLSNRWSFNAGLRYDKNDGTDQSGNPAVKDAAFSPRLSATFDPRGDGKFTLNAAYAQYVAAIANGQGDAGSSGGQPAAIDFDYLGPAVNVGNPANPVSSADALATLWGWFNANGGTNRPTRGAPSIPGVNTKVGDRLKSPNAREFTIGFTHRLGTRGSVRADGVFRSFKDFYSTRADLSTGKVTDNLGRSFDLRVTENTNDVERSYKGMNLQVSYRALDRLNLGGNYTLGKVTGNFEGETGPNGTVAAQPDFYPEYHDPAWNLPIGEMLTSVRHKVRLWAVWETPVPAVLGKVTLSGLLFYNSGTPYGSSGNVDTRPYVPNPGYATPPATKTYFFEPRDTYRTADMWRSDLAVNWARRLAIRNSEVFFRARLLNVFNRDELTNFFDGDCGTGGCINTTINTNNNVASLARFNPFTAQPVQGTNWTKAATFGTATSRFAYQTPRTFDVSVGFRF